MTDHRPYFTQIIGHNSVNFHRIPTNVGTEILPLSVPNFNPIRVRIRVVLWRILRSVRNEEEKTKKLKRNFVRSYLGNGGSEFLQIWYVDSPNWPARLQ